MALSPPMSDYGNADPTEPAANDADNAMPDPASDAYAFYVLSAGGQRPLSDIRLALMRNGVNLAVQRSRRYLADQRTADAIRDTVVDALRRSRTFRAAVSFGIHRNGDALDDITYRNRYVINIDSCYPVAPADIGTLTIDELKGSMASDAPIVAANEAQRHHDGGANGCSCISFSVAPDADSPYLPSWQQGLIHEIMHHIAGAEDPQGTAEYEHGAPEILSRLVAEDMDWPVPESQGYGDPIRIAHVLEWNFAALIEAAQRHAKHQQAFFERLETLSRGGSASNDFRELGAAIRTGTL
jgi:hypothetical protein